MITELGTSEIKQALDLVNRVFSEFVAIDYSEQGNKTFNCTIINIRKSGKSRPTTRLRVALSELVRRRGRTAQLERLRLR